MEGEDKGQTHRPMQCEEKRVDEANDMRASRLQLDEGRHQVQDS
jgi:hypothetical protein